MIFVNTILYGLILGRSGKINMKLSPEALLTSKLHVGSDWSTNELFNSHPESAAILKNQDLVVFYSDGELHKYNYIDSTVSSVINFLNSNHIDYQVFEYNSLQSQVGPILNFGLQLIFLLFILNLVTSNMNPSNSIMNKLNPDLESVADRIDTRFEDVAGLDEAKEELEEIVDYLKNPFKYVEIGAKIPKGVLIEGPPGTGKTLLARAVAGEAGVSFLSASASSFIEMFVGVGASRIRKLFEEARKNKPCVIFIDEIDAIGTRRSSGFNGGGGSEEREQTLNQLLTNMDGFEKEEGIIVLAATNRAELLDPALKRSGRFDRKVYVGLPDKKGREEILKVHTKNKKMDNISYSKISELISGFSGADIQNLANEAAILTVRDNKTIIDENSLIKAYEKMTIGLPKKNDYRSIDVKTLVAVHESGHALMVAYFKNYFNLKRVTINSNTNGVGGYTLFTPYEDLVEYPTKGYFIAQIIVALGGRAAEIIYFKNNISNYNEINEITDPFITVGASNDLKQAKKIAKEYFKLFYNLDTENAGNHLVNNLDIRVNHLLDECLNKSMNILYKNQLSFNTLIRLLVENTTVNY
jgi:cell division protease FtsH